jgi:hypothetical protein
MTFHGNQYGRLGEQVSNQVADDLSATDSTGQHSDGGDITEGSIGRTVLFAIIAGFLVLIAMGAAIVLVSW